MTPFVSPGMSLENKESEAVKEILESGWFCLGKHTDELEDKFKEMCGVRHAIACCNATNGLIIAFKALGIENKLVALPAFTWPSTLYALECNGNTPYYCDIYEDTWTINLDSNPTTSVDAYVAVDTFGNPAEIYTNKPVIYDAAHGFGMKQLGGRGDVEVVSFSFTKPVTAGGQGGIILTNDDDIHKEARELVRLSAKMMEINALVAIHSMKSYFKRFNDNMRVMDLYRSFIKVPFKEQKYLDGGNHSTFAILLEDSRKRNKCFFDLKKAGIETKIYYEPLVSGFPVTDKIYSRILCLPVYADMVGKIPIIAKVINEA